jgi:hypothetical protein
MPGVTAESLDREVEDILAPLRAKLRQIDGELEQLDLQRAELKAVRTKVARIVGANQTYATTSTARNSTRPRYATGSHNSSGLPTTCSIRR